MKLRSRLLSSSSLLVALSAASAGQAATQVPPSVRRGMMSTAPVGLLLESSPPSELLIANPGQAGVAPTPWSSARFGAPGGDYPEYTLDAIFHDLAPVVVLTGVSTGNDWMPPVDADGTLDMQDLWFALTVSVTNDSHGTATSHVERVFAGGTDSPGSELFTYYASDSVGINYNLPNTTVSERSRESLGLVSQQGVDPEALADVSGLDYGLGVIPFDPDDRAGGMFPHRDRIYFTVAAECVAALGPDFAHDPFGVDVPANPATIYRSTWYMGSTGYAWSKPEVYCSALELCLSPVADQIDAIAVNPAAKRVIFSTQPVAGRNQLLVYEPLVVSPPKPLKASNHVEVTVHLGLTESSDVDGTCGIDPELAFNYSGAVGIPETAYTDGDNALGISVSRAQPGAGGADSLHVHVTGAMEGSAPGYILLYVAEGQTLLSGTPLSLGSWIFIDAQAYSAGQEGASWVFPAPDMALKVGLMAYLAEPAPAPEYWTPTRLSQVSILKFEL